MVEKLFLSGYTRISNKGIHEMLLDPEKRKSSSRLLIDEINCSYMVTSRDRDYIFTVSSVDDGSVAMYKLVDGEYRFRDRVGGLGNAPCHLYYDEHKKLILASNYHQGKVDIIKVGEYDDLTKLEPIVIVGRSIKSPDQDKSRCHMCIPDYRHSYYIVVNLGTDALYSYDINSRGGFRHVNTFKVKPGAGPRHMVFSENGEYAYVACELSSEVEVLTYEKGNSEFGYVGSYSTLPEGYSDVNTASAIRLSNDGRFLYVSNRGHDSIAVFSVQGDKLTLVQTMKTGGKNPRDFNFNSDESLVIVGHQDSDTVTVFSRDEKSGTLKKADGMDLNLSEIVCITE